MTLNNQIEDIWIQDLENRSRRSSANTDSGSVAKNRAASEPYKSPQFDVPSIKVPVYGDDSVDFK